MSSLPIFLQCSCRNISSNSRPSASGTPQYPLHPTTHDPISKIRINVPAGTFRYDTRRPWRHKPVESKLNHDTLYFLPQEILDVMFLQEHFFIFLCKAPQILSSKSFGECSCRNIGRVLHTNSLHAQQFSLLLKCEADYAAQ